MAESDLDYAKITGRFGLTVADGPDTGDLPDIIWCDEGTVRITPLITYTKVVGASPVPWTAGHSVIDATIDSDGYLTHLDKRFVWVVDVTSEKVNPRIPDGQATHRVEFINVRAGGTRVEFQAATVRLTATGPDGDGVNDLTKALPVPTGSAVPIVRGERGVSIESASVEGGDLVLSLDDGTALNAGELPVGPGGSDAGVASYLAAPGSDTAAAAREFVAGEIGDPESPAGTVLSATIATALDTAVPAASTTAAGKVELATPTEAEAGSDATRVVTPLGVRSALIADSHLVNLQATNLRRWSLALAKMRNGASDAKILCVGDSTTTGAKSSTEATIPQIKSYPARLAELLNAHYATAAPGLGVPKSTSSSQPADARWTTGPNWTLNGGTLTFLGFGGKGMYYSGGGLGTMTYADNRITADTFDVYYVSNPGGGSAGSFDVSATGGSTTRVDTAAGSGVRSIKKVTVTAASAATSNVVSMTHVANAVFVVGVEPYLSTTKKIRVGNAGASGSKTEDWCQRVAGVNSTNLWGGLDSIKAYAPDLTIIDLGINDAGNSVPLADYLNYLGQIIAAAQVSGDVILKTMLPSADSLRIGFEDQYVAGVKALGLPVIDYYGRVLPHAAFNGSGLMNADGVHGNDYGYLDVATFAFEALRGF